MISQEEWQQAKRLFAALPEQDRKPGTKISRGTASNLSHSFLLTQGGVFLGLANKTEGILGHGGYARVKLSEDEAGNLYALKRLSHPVTYNSLFFIASEEEEMLIAYDIGDATESTPTFRESKSGMKVYLPYIYLGKSLKKYLEKTTWTDDEALRFAIHLALLIDDLHQGKLSKTGKCLYHGDLKPDNITIDKEGNPHLIDFGREGGITDGYCGIYINLDGEDGDWFRQARDLFGYIRTIFFPPESRRKVWLAHNKSVLSDYLVQQHPKLKKLLNTTDDHLNPRSSLIEIAKVLTQIRCHIDADVPLDSAEAIRHANTQYDASIVPRKRDMESEEIMAAAVEQFKRNLDALLATRPVAIQNIREKLHISEVEQEKVRVLAEAEAIAKPVLSLLDMQDHQTRKSGCLQEYYDLQCITTEIAKEQIQHIMYNLARASYGLTEVTTADEIRLGF